VEKADTFLLLGTDASLSHPLLENRIRKAYRRDKKVIRFGSSPNRTSTFTSNELHHRPGGEEALLFLLLSALDKKFKQNDLVGPAEDQAGIAVSQLEQVISHLESSRRLVLVVGDDLLRQSSSGNIVRMLYHLYEVLDNNGHCGILFPGYEGNLYGNALAGLHPDYLPGFRKIGSSKKGLTCNQMLGIAGKEGTNSLMVFGDLPEHNGVDRLEFLVQCNMFKTKLTEHADVLLPLPHFLESEGHLLSMDYSIKKVNRAIIPPGNVKSISWIISSLAKALGETGFSHKPAEIFRELKPILEITGENKTKPSSPELQFLKGEEVQKGKAMQKAYPVSLIMQHNHYRYRGSSLSKLVPELGPITHEGTVGLPDELMKKLKVEAGERVRIITENGSMDSLVRPIPGLTGQTASFCPNGSPHSGIHKELYPEDPVIHVKIEKV
jgi:anaerobic selenocysteine-containing dehydrogenase